MHTSAQRLPGGNRSCCAVSVCMSGHVKNAKYNTLRYYSQLKKDNLQSNCLYHPCSVSMWVNTAPINTVVSNETLKTSKDDFNIDNQSVNICVHARLLQADPSPAPGEGWRAPARIATPAETCGPIRSHCRGAAANQRARPRDWTTGPPTPRTDTPDPGERERGRETLSELSLS